MPTQDRLIFKQVEDNLYVSAYAPYTDFLGEEVQIYVGCFRIGEEEFNIDSNTHFLTVQDLRDIITKMEEYSGN